MSTSNQANGAAKYTHRAIVGGEELLFAFDGTESWKDDLDKLVQKHGGAPPRIEAIADTKIEVDSMPATDVGAYDATAIRRAANDPERLALTADAAPRREQTIVRGETIVEEGRARSAADEALAKANGFAPRQPLYARGTAVIDMGVENAREKREEFDAMPPTSKACRDLVAKIDAETREDVRVRASSLRMRRNGALVVPAGDGRYSDHAIGIDALGALMTRLGPGGGGYLEKCPTALRAINVNHWAQEIGNRDEAAQKKALIQATLLQKQSSWEPTRCVLRTRRNESLDAREVFAVVSEGYTAFDVDKIAEALRIASPEGARGSVKYDGTRATFDVLFHSNVRPEDYVAGEFFRAGVRVRTDDTGGGGIRVSAIVWQNLCLNLIVIDQAEQRIASLRHVGGVEKLANRFRASFADALDKIEGFRRAWGYAVEDDVLAAARATQGDYVPMKVSEALPGLFEGILERELVPVRGSKPEAVKRLVEAYSKDDSAAVRLPDGGRREYLSRAAVVNAFTRYAHEAPQSDPFFADQIERAAGALLTPNPRTNVYRALPYADPRG